MIHAYRAFFGGLAPLKFVVKVALEKDTSRYNIFGEHVQTNYFICDSQFSGQVMLVFAVQQSLPADTSGIRAPCISFFILQQYSEFFFQLQAVFHNGSTFHLSLSSKK